MLKANKFRIYPDTNQRIALAKSFGCARWFWNYALNLSQKTYKKTGKGLSRKAIQSLLPGLKKQFTWLRDCYSQCLQFVCLNLSTAFKNFFDNRARYPRFKSKKGRQSITFPQHVKIEGEYLKLPGKVGRVYTRFHKPLDSELRSVTVSMNPDGKYYASILVDDAKEQPEPTTKGKAIGIDLGLTHFAITSEGSKYDNPRHIAKHTKNLKRKQQNLSRKQKGSSKGNKARLQLAKVQGKIARCREDFLHKLSRKIVNENQVIAVEDLAVKNMMRNNNLAKAISDVGWGMFCTMLKYKCDWEGKTYIEVSRWFPSSKMSHLTGYRFENLTLSERMVFDPIANQWLDRDINAAVNIRDEALRILALGSSVTAHRGDVRQPGKISVLSDAIPVELGSP